MHRGFYVATVIVPLLLGSGFLLFGIFSDYWISLNYSKVKQFDSSSLKSGTYELRKIRFEFPKFSSLFDECNEYKIIEVLDPVNVPKSELSMYQGESANNETNKLFHPSEILTINNEINEEKRPNDECLTKEECNSLNPNENGSCFCCKRDTADGEVECCNPRSSLCDGIKNCNDGSDELENCPLKKVFYSRSWYDNKHKCQRHQYNFFSFLKKALNLKQRFNSNSTDNFCLREIVSSSNFTIRVFMLKLFTLTSFGFCVLFTFLCLITVIFVSCCRNLNENSLSGSNNDITLYGQQLGDDDLDSSSSKLGACCCKCNCLLCPFVFYSTFSILAFISHLIGLITYVYSIFYTRNAYLIFDIGFQPKEITKAYQYNPWLFDVQELGISFYAIMISFVFYLIMFICSTCITCRIQMSPAWSSRYTSSYEVLQMQDIVFNNKKAEKKSKKQKKKEKSVELEDVDAFSDNSGETQGLTRPKTNLQAIDNSRGPNIYRV